MKIFNSCAYHVAWHPEPVAHAAEALEFALYRYRKMPWAPASWKSTSRDTVKACVESLKYAKRIHSSEQAKHLAAFFPQERRASRGNYQKTFA